MVEHSAVNREAVGSNPTRGANPLFLSKLNHARIFGVRRMISAPNRSLCELSSFLGVCVPWKSTRWFQSARFIALNQLTALTSCSQQSRIRDFKLHNRDGGRQSQLQKAAKRYTWNDRFESTSGCKNKDLEGCLEYVGSAILRSIEGRFGLTGAYIFRPDDVVGFPRSRVDRFRAQQEERK
jgi:hypothetical protein